MDVQPGLCGTWSETPKTGFLTTRLICSADYLVVSAFILFACVVVAILKCNPYNLMFNMELCTSYFVVGCLFLAVPWVVDNLNIMRQPVCLVINPITVNNYDVIFNHTPLDRASNVMMVPT